MKILICVVYSVFIVFSFIGFALQALNAFGAIDIKSTGLLGFYSLGYMVNFILVLDRLKGVVNHGKLY